MELVTPDRHVGQEVTGTAYPAYLGSFYAAGVRLTPDHRLIAVRRTADRRLEVDLWNDYTRTTIQRTVDQVVVEYGTVPNAEVYEALREGSSNGGELDLDAYLAGQPQTRIVNPTGSSALRIGDAVASRNIHAAIYDARRIAPPPSFGRNAHPHNGAGRRAWRSQKIWLVPAQDRSPMAALVGQSALKVGSGTSAGTSSGAPAPALEPAQLLERDVAAHLVAGLDLDERRLDDLAQAPDDARAAGVEDAAGRRVGRARDLALEQDPRGPRRRRSGRRTAAPPCRGGSGRGRPVSEAPTSMIRPRYMTAIRSAR